MQFHEGAGRRWKWAEYLYGDSSTYSCEAKLLPLFTSWNNTSIALQYMIDTFGYIFVVPRI